MTVSSSNPDRRRPVYLLTGFLGSGKTTLLRHMLADPALADTAVVINEFGEVGLDHLLVRDVAEDVILLSSGCLCCTVRDDLISTLLDLHRSSAAGTIPQFSRVAVETTGLADPFPILQLIPGYQQLPQFYRVGGVIATVDAVNGATTLDQYPEAVQQLVAADRLIITKADLADPAKIADLNARANRLNPTCTRFISRIGAFPRAHDLLAPVSSMRPLPPNTSSAAASAPVAATHTDRISVFTVTLDERVDLASFIEWLELLLASRGESVLRVKGYLSAKGYDRPLAIQGVQHVVYRPEPLPPDSLTPPSRSELVFITRDLTRTAIERSIRSVLDAVAIADAAPASAQLPAS